MGSSPDATICYGIAFEDEHEFPFEDPSDVDDWWREVNGYSNPHPFPFDKFGNYLPGEDSNTTKAWSRHKRDWLDANPVPFEVVHCYSYEANCVVLAVPGMSVNAFEGGPVEIDPGDLVFRAEHSSDAIVPFIQCIEKYGIHDCPILGWYLTAFYG